MAVNFYERNDSRDLEATTRDGSATLRWNVVATAGEDAESVWVQVLSFCPLIFGGLVRDNIRLRPLGGPAYDLEIHYGVLTSDGPAGNTPGSATPPAGSSSPTDEEGFGPGFSFDISSEQVHITQSRETQYARRPQDGNDTDPLVFGTAPDYKHAIGVTKDKIEGCDIPGGKMEFTIPAVRDTCTRGYLKKIKALVGRTNNAVWSNFPADSLLYLGATGQYAGDGGVTRYNISHKFAAGEHEVNLEPSPEILIPLKRAWEYMWCAYEEKVVGNFVLQVPAAVYVETVMGRGDFRNLEIGG